MAMGAGAVEMVGLAAGIPVAGAIGYAAGQGGMKLYEATEEPIDVFFTALGSLVGKETGGTHEEQKKGVSFTAPQMGRVEPAGRAAPRPAAPTAPTPAAAPAAQPARTPTAEEREALRRQYVPRKPGT